MRKKIILICTECLSRNYTTTKRVEDQTVRLELNKFCPRCGKYTVHKESKWGEVTMKKIVGYFRGVGQEAKRVRWPKSKELLGAILVVLVITIIAGIFLVLEDSAGGVLVSQLRQAFESIRG